MKTLLLSLLAAASTLAATAHTNIVVGTDNVQLVLQVKDNGRLYQTYLGERLSDATDPEQLAMPYITPTSSGTLGYEAYPVMGTEDYYEPAMEIRHADGNPTTILKYVSHEQKAADGATETIIRLRDEVYPVSVTLHYLAYADDDIIKQWSEIRHDERGEVRLGRYASSMLYMEGARYYVTDFGSKWAKEMQMQQTELIRGKKIIDTRLGTRASLITQPFFELSMDAPATEDHGTVLMGTLGWTGNFRFTFEVDHDGALRVISGINPDASEYVLPRGETFRTPDFIFTLSTEGIGRGSRNFARWAIDHQLFMGKGDRMTLLNNWENTYFAFNESMLESLIGEAKDLGVDLFLLDDGWFGNKYPRSLDNAGLGDWQVTREKLPNGVPHLVKTANEKGVEFGIWIEPEMVNPKSELAEKHPDWILRLPNRDTYYFRNQLVLDLSNPQVQDFVFGVVDDLMTENPRLKFFKWDCNSPITNIYSHYEKQKQGNLYVDYVRGLYSVLDRIQKKYPSLRMMLCSGGGGRCDYEALKYFTEFWCSDNTDPAERLYIQWGFSHFMPAKAMCAHVTDWNTRASVKFRVDVAFSCKLGFDIGLSRMADADKQYCRDAIKEYNRLKPVLFSPDTYRLVSPYAENHCALMRVNDSRDHALLFAYDIHPRYDETIRNTRLQGLDADAQYKVSEICLMPGQQSQLSCHGKTYTGDYLMKVGLKVLSAGDMVSHIVEIVKQ